LGPMNDFAFNPGLVTAPPLWLLSNGFSFTLGSITMVDQATPNFLNLTGNGVVVHRDHTRYPLHLDICQRRSGRSTRGNDGSPAWFRSCRLECSAAIFEALVALTPPIVGLTTTLREEATPETAGLFCSWAVAQIFDRLPKPRDFALLDAQLPSPQLRSVRRRRRFGVPRGGGLCSQ
jgi:hypothetical protein